MTVSQRRQFSLSETLEPGSRNTDTQQFASYRAAKTRTWTQQTRMSKLRPDSSLYSRPCMWNQGDGVVCTKTSVCMSSCTCSVESCWSSFRLSHSTRLLLRHVVVQRGLCKLGDVFKLVKRKAVPHSSLSAILKQLTNHPHSRAEEHTPRGVGWGFDIVTTSELAGGGGANNPNLTFAGSGSTLP